MKKLALLFLFIPPMFLSSAQAEVLTFENLPTDGTGFYNGNTAAGSPQRDNYTVVGTQPDGFGNTTSLQRWVFGGVEFNNNYTPDPNFPSWTGWSWSSVQDTTTPGSRNQYASAPGGGSDVATALPSDGQTYLMAFGNGAFFNLPTSTALQAADLTNGTYSALSIRDGDAFADPFGGPGGDEPDLFQVTFNGFSGANLTGTATGSVTVDLADYRFADNTNDYIVTDWQRTDLSALGDARSVSLAFTTTDVGPFGPNTPLYVAVDNLNLVAAVPEPSSMIVLALAGLAVIFRRKSRKLLS